MSIVSTVTVLGVSFWDPGSYFTPTEKQIAKPWLKLDHSFQKDLSTSAT